MISERTVELNLSMELINHISYRNNLRVFALAPTQRAEGRLGYDVEVGFGNGDGILIQYKRAYIDGNEYIYHINHTKNQNQHQILLNLERKGHLVLYAFPLFHEVNQIRAYRRQLLLYTAWFNPSQINLPGGPVGRHDLHIDRTTFRWRVRSKNLRHVKGSLDFSIVNKFLRNKKFRGKRDINKLISDINELINKNEEGSNSNKEIGINHELKEQFIIGITENE